MRTKKTQRVTRAAAEEAVKTLLRWAGDDPSREGLKDTPARVARAFEDWFSGYKEDPEEYLLRTFELQISARTYTPSVADAPRFLIAGIGGAVVGLFNNFAIGQGVSIPPLAIAVLVAAFVGLVSSFIPAYRASTQNIVEGLRHIG